MDRIGVRVKVRGLREVLERRKDEAKETTSGTLLKRMSRWAGVNMGGPWEARLVAVWRLNDEARAGGRARETWQGESQGIEIKREGENYSCVTFICIRIPVNVYEENCTA